MSAILPESGVSEALPPRLALIAGGGSLPALFLDACDKSGIDVFVVVLEGQADQTLTEGRPHMVSRIGAAGSIIGVLKERGIRDMVFIGSVRRPGLAELRPDLRTAAFFLKLGMKALGDDGLLQAMRRELEKEGFRIHGIQKFMPGNLTAEGAIGRNRPDDAAWADIRHGAAVARELGRLDIGQSVIVQQGIVIGVEAIEGTDELIRRCAMHQRKGRGGILVKIAKPQQDRDLDLPTVGPETVRLCAEAGMAGIAVEAGQSLMLDSETVAALADKSGLFVVGVDLKRAEGHDV